MLQGANSGGLVWRRALWGVCDTIGKGRRASQTWGKWAGSRQYEALLRF